jgi:hypothetical protein
MKRKQRDQNAKGIIRDLEAVGASWLDLGDLGEGAPDGLVGFRGENTLIEFKNPNQSPSKRKLRPKQKLFADMWRGKPVEVIETRDQAFCACGIYVVKGR